MEGEPLEWMRFRSTRHARYWCGYHLTWIPKYRGDILIGEVAEYTREILNEILRELGCESSALEVMPNHVFALCPPIIKVGYPKYIAQENGNFNNLHIWTYRYLLRRIYEVAEEYGITVVYVNEEYTSSKCPIHGDKCGNRVKRGLFKCTNLNKIFNADIVGAYNILITPSPTWDRGNGLETQPGIKPRKQRDVIPNLPALAGNPPL